MKEVVLTESEVVSNVETPERFNQAMMTYHVYSW